MIKPFRSGENDRYARWDAGGMITQAKRRFMWTSVAEAGRGNRCGEE